MTITREQVRDLQPGDVVEYSGHVALKGAKVVGPLTVNERDGALLVADYVVRYPTGDAPWVQTGDLTLAVVSRAPRALYVNHPRTEPVDGDIVRDCDGDAWLYRDGEWFVGTAEDEGPDGPEYFKPLNLLWDGETGRAVQ